MKNTPIEILGITSEEEISKYNIQYPYKEFCKSYTIRLTKSKPKIGQILKVFLKPKINEWKYIFTQGEFKIFIEGSIKIRILFLENPYDQDIYSTEINKIISGFLPVESSCMDNLKPTLFIEEAFIDSLNENKFSVSLLIAMGTISEEKCKNKKVIDKEKNFEQQIDFKEEVQYENIEDADFEEEVQYENIEDADFKEEVQYENIEDVDSNEEVQYENIEDVDFNEEVQYRDIEDASFKEEAQYKNIEDVDFNEEVQHENIEDIDFNEEAEYENIEDVDSKEEVEYENIEDVDSKEEVKYENIEDEDLKEEVQYKNIEDIDLKEEAQYENIEEAEDKNLEGADLLKILLKDLYNISSKEVNLKETDFSELDMKKLKENSVDINVEYDMNWQDDDS
ncbi:RNA polymerase subunit sigma [Clostridium botulinum]|uniref:RNA polymerase subunit sigma n=1 Tax=Clostridium botulinum TaxID=1491 RepID=UPI000A174BA3|nr:RNA polymerase subunit sigma [Clostridium botulinum]OSB02287.1 RNA polymerase subunit sigma [Clostridium botulinum]